MSASTTSSVSVSIRTYSIANSGLPPMLRSTRSRSDSVRMAVESRVSTSAEVSSSLSGASRIVVLFARPPPQDASVSNSSGRAVHSTTSGASASSTIAESTSRSAGSDQCRSSIVSTSGRSAADASRTRAAAEATSATGTCPSPPVTSASTDRRVRSHARSDSADSARATSAAKASLDDVGRRRRDASPRARGRPRSSMRTRSCRRRARTRSASQPTSSPSARRSSSTSRLLPMPGSATIVTSCAHRSSRARATMSSSIASSRSRPTSDGHGRAATPSARRAPPRRGSAPPSPWR